MAQTLFDDDAPPEAQPATPIKASAPKKDASIARYRRMFDDSREAMMDGRTIAARARDYYDGNQLTAAQRQTLKDRQQPDVVINRVRRAVDGILGVVGENKSDPRALMRNPAKPNPMMPQTPMPQRLQMGANGGPPMPMPMGGPPPGQAPGTPPMGSNVVPFPGAGVNASQPTQPTLDAGDVATMALRYIADKARFQNTKMDVLEHVSIEGAAAALIGITQKKEIPITFIPFEEYFWDARCRKADFSDKRYDGVAKWMYADDVAALYPDKKDEIDRAVTAGDAGLGADPLWEDKPDRISRPWIDRKARRLMMVEMYHREEGTWMRCCFYGGGFLEEPAQSPYTDEDGQPCDPIEGVAGYVSRELVRYGVVKDMLDVQDEINARRSKAIHEIQTRQIQAQDANAPPCEVDDARKEAARPDGVLPTGYVIVPRQDVIANNITMLQEAKQEIERLAPNPAIIGRTAQDASGRAQQFRAQAGMTELSRFLGRLKDWEERVYRQAWARARQHWDSPQWIRVTNDTGAPQYVMVNDYENARFDPMTGQIAIPNRIAEMDVDIVLDSTKDTATLEQEIFNELLQLAAAYVGTPQQVPFKVLLEMSPLPKRQEIIKRLEAAQAEAAQAAAPAVQLKTAETQSDIRKTDSETEKNLATANKIKIEGTYSAMEGVAHARNPERGLLPPQPKPPAPTGA